VTVLDFDPWQAAGLPRTPLATDGLAGLAFSRTQKLRPIAGARAAEGVAIAAEPASLRPCLESWRRWQ
jgi:hypothetical protein